MRISRRRGRLRVEFEPIEVDALTRLFDELARLVNEGDAADPVIARLYPSAYPYDADAEADYREITMDGLRTDRLERIGACGVDLLASGGAGIELDDEAVARRWLQTLNDLRLAIGTRIGVREDEIDEMDEMDDPHDDGPEDGDGAAQDVPTGQDRILYHWLTHLQDAVVTGLMA